MLALALSTGLATRALAFEPPPLTGRVVDRADALSPDFERRLEQALERYESETGHQIVVHVTPSLEGLPIEDYSIEVAEAWKVGNAKLDDGVILTIAPTERRYRFEVGYGLEGVIPDALAARIGRESLVPAFRAGDLEAGVIVGIERIAAAAKGEPGQPVSRQRRSRGGSPFGGHLLWLIVLLLFLGGPRGLFLLPFLGGMGRGGGFGGGGGGGFSGGGGGFGGGGASGSW